MNKLKLLDLFSGIGGFSYGLESTNGFETIAFCEKDKFCQKVLRKHWNNIKIYEDVRNINGKEIKADIVTGGFPCQPFSVAGKRRGTDDDRYLWDETIRVIAEAKPKWFVGENVEGIVNIQEGKVLQQIQKDLETENFQVQCLIIPASGIGAWHQRKRVWIIANSENLSGRNTSTHNAQNGSKEFSKEDVKLGIKSSLSNNVSNSDNNGSHRPKRNATIESGNEQKDRLSIGDDKNVSNSNTGLFIGENKEIQARRIASNNGGQDVSNSNAQRTQIQAERKYSGEQMSGSNSSESWWQTQSRICGVPDGISYGLDKDRVNRIKSLGNSIVPEIAKEIGLAILEAENE